MELTNEFVIERPVEETWRVLNDLEFIAPCMPGAQLTEIEGDEYRGQVKIKVGPITAAYKGKASFVEQDAANKIAKLKAEGRDPRQGNANAMVVATMTPSGDNATTVNIHTDLALSGKIASFGRGAIEDVSKKILNQFTDNLRDKLAEGAAPAGGAPIETAPPVAPASVAAAATTAAAPSAVGSATQPPAAAASVTAASTTEAPATEAPTVRKIDSPEPEPVDILSVAPDSLTKKALPVLGGLVGLLVIRWLLRGRGSDD